jgi:hypothetical protein
VAAKEEEIAKLKADIDFLNKQLDQHDTKDYQHNL